MRFLHRPQNVGDKLRRAGWILLTALFIFTGLGVGVYAFWQDTHSSDNTNSSTQQPSNTTACSFNGAQSAPKLDAPAPYKPETKITSLVTSDLVVGTGQAAQKGDCLLVKYYGTLASNGKEFDEDYTQPLALQFLVGEGYVIPGWDQGLIGMKVGGERRLLIPSSLGYGKQGQGAIPPNADLVFVVKLLSIK
ncbi:MAG TPA: FKBP-type peptidyl-prolyl cis-trans isomerase [Candidatus Saccharimonadales bacterium]|nr:FKBP-type peptidyl-prolyl cis-trans isomerase [Candidatus Saccharimonadales bacterium]